MLKLTIETKNETLKAQIENAYNEALNTTNMDAFMRSLDVNTEDNIMVGKSGSHIWISEASTGVRHAMIII